MERGDLRLDRELVKGVGSTTIINTSEQNRQTFQFRIFLSVSREYQEWSMTRPLNAVNAPFHGHGRVCITAFFRLHGKVYAVSQIHSEWFGLGISCVGPC